MNPRRRDIVVVGGSAGAIPALSTVLSALPVRFPATMLVALHRGVAGAMQLDQLTDVFTRRTTLTVTTAEDQQLIEAGHVYITPGGQHMVLENGLTCLQRSPKEHRFRPCIDVLFKSAAASYGPRVVGVLLSGGFGPDGSAGLWRIADCGGVTIVQDPADAAYGGMPQAALDTVAADYVLPAAHIGPKLIELASRPRAQRTPILRL